MASLWVTAQRAWWVMEQGICGETLTQHSLRLLCGAVSALGEEAVQCLGTATAADSNMWSGLEFKCFGRPSEAKVWKTLCPNGSPKQLAALQG